MKFEDENFRNRVSQMRRDFFYLQLPALLAQICVIVGSAVILMWAFKKLFME